MSKNRFSLSLATYTIGKPATLKTEVELNEIGMLLSNIPYSISNFEGREFIINPVSASFALI